MNGWKVTAIIFIVLFVLQTSLIIYIYRVGVESIENEVECSVNICSDPRYDAYYYDDITEVCSCYSDGEIGSQKYMGSK